MHDDVYEVLAEVIRRAGSPDIHPVERRTWITNALCDELERIDPRFDRECFLDATIYRESGR